MACAYITDMQMPHTFWFWAIRHAAQVMNYIPCMVNGVKTSSFKLVYGIKPYYRVLFHLFSTSCITHSSDGTCQHDGIAEATFHQVIVVGHCKKSDGLSFYSPHSKQFYHSSDY